MPKYIDKIETVEEMCELMSDYCSCLGIPIVYIFLVNSFVFGGIRFEIDLTLFIEAVVGIVILGIGFAFDLYIALCNRSQLIDASSAPLTEVVVLPVSTFRGGS